MGLQGKVEVSPCVHAPQTLRMVVHDSSVMQHPLSTVLKFREHFVMLGKQELAAE